MNKQLSRTDVKNAKRRFRENLPVNLRQLAAALELSYSAVLAWKRIEGFPYDHWLIFPEDFTLWRRRRLGLTGRVPKAGSSAQNRADRLRVDANTIPEPSPSPAFLASLPLRTRRLYEHLGL